MYSENDDNGREMMKIVSERINAASTRRNKVGNDVVSFDRGAKANSSPERPVSDRRSGKPKPHCFSQKCDSTSDSSSDELLMKIVAERSHAQDTAEGGTFDSVETSTSSVVASSPGADSESTQSNSALSQQQQQQQQQQPGAYRFAPGSNSPTPNPLPPILTARSPKCCPVNPAALPQQGAWASRHRRPSNGRSNQALEGHQAVLSILDGVITPIDATTTTNASYDQESAESTGTEEKPSNDERRGQEESDEQIFAYTVYLLVACIGIGALVAILVIAIGPESLFPLTNTSSQYDGNNIDSNSFPPFMSHQDALESFQESMMVEHNDDEYATVTPQAAAFNWVANDPFLMNYPLWRIQQRYALAVLFYHLSPVGVGVEDVPSLISYNQSECEWTWRTNVTKPTACGLSTGVYKRLDLLEFPVPINILPSEIAMLTALERLTVSNVPNSNASLSTFLPVELGQLSRLSVLEVSNSPDLQPGPIPPFIYQLAALKDLQLSKAQLTGTISPAINRLTELESLMIFDNRLRGALPSDLPATLGSVDVRRNHLTGTLPSSWISLNGLIELQLSFNAALEGEIPVEWGSAMTSMQVLGVEGTNLSGAIPQGFCSRPPLHRMVFFADCAVLDCCHGTG